MNDWTKRFPRIVEAALKNRRKQFVIDGEAVILGVDEYSGFNALHSGKHNDDIQLCAFDVLVMDGDDLLPNIGELIIGTFRFAQSSDISALGSGVPSDRIKAAPFPSCDFNSAAR